MSNGNKLERTLSFSGPIQHNATKVLRNMCCAAVNEGVTHMTILFSSEGGSLDDGFALYALLRSLPLELTMHNIGIVGSMANAVFLAGKNRIASPHAIFFFHDLHWRYGEVQTIRSGVLEEHSMLLEVGRTRLQALFNLHAENGNAVFNNADFFKKPTIHNAAAAKHAGIVHHITDAVVLAGTRMINADWN